jgi:prepilin-type processing-associated H-X9-DG protein
MPSLSLPRIAAALALAAGLAGPAAAADCRLSLWASDHILMPGETAQIDVWAYFPPAAFAFASAEFDVEAEIPGWSFASSGAIAGASVLGATASQAHQPHLGLPADPTNPTRIWTGTFAPDSYEPRLVTVKATPSDFEIYPSELTGSSAPCPADPGATRLLINPMTASTVAFAPVEGTPVRARWHSGGANFAMGDGSVRTVGGGIALLLPAVQKVREAAARLETTGDPASLGILTAISGDADDRPTEEVAFYYNKIAFNYAMAIDWASAIGFTTRLFRDGRLLGEYTSDGDGDLPIIVGRIPNSQQTRIGDEPTLTIYHTLVFDEPAPAGPPGTPGELVDRIEIAGAGVQNNLKQFGIALHSYHVESDREPATLTVGIDVPCRVDLNGDGAVDFFDFLAFQDLFSKGDALADFSGDGSIDFFDFLAFQDEFSRGCR